MRSDDSSFYIGYQPKAAPGTARFLKRHAAALLALGCVCAVAAVLVQRPLPPSAFEFGVESTVSGTLQPRPYPNLILNTTSARLWLVAPGKHGAEDIVGAMGGPVRLKGSLIYRGPDAMIEIVPGSVEATRDVVSAASAGEELGRQTLEGEIVDSKCFLGVMNPGRGVVHHDCAVRCIAGGIPPALATSDRLYVLTAPGGTRLDPAVVLPLVGAPVRINGLVRRLGSSFTVEIEPQAIRLLRRE